MERNTISEQTIQDLVKNKEISGLTIKECEGIKANKPDVLVLNSDKQIVIFLNPHVRTLDTTINETVQTIGY